MRDWLPDAVGGVTYFNLDDATMVAYVPVYCGINRIPEPFRRENNNIREFSTESAFWMNNWVANMVYPRWSALYPDLREAQKELEDYYAEDQKKVEEAAAKMDEFRELLKNGKQVAFVIRKGALEYSEKVDYKNDNLMIREEIIRHIVDVSGEDPIVSTTGKASRELFEIREANGQKHGYDFLTVGSMGHSSSIALGVALNKPETKIWCVDGDGALLMHMGSMAVIGANAPENLVHIVINNGAHETVGGMPTVASKIDVVAAAKACGYPNDVSVDNYADLDRELENAKQSSVLSLIEVKCSIGARADLGRPTTTAIENKNGFMENLSNS